MSLREVALSGWTGDPKAVDQTAALESGNLLLCKQLRFEVAGREARLFTPAILGGAKNASFDPVSGRLGGMSLTGKAAEQDYLRSLGAADVKLTSTIDLENVRPMEAGQWAGAVDNVGGPILHWVLAL